MVKYCQKCGTPNEDTAQFCLKCGSQFLQVYAQPIQQPLLHTRQTPTSAFVLSLIGGVFVILGGSFVTILGLWGAITFYGNAFLTFLFGVLGITWGVIMVFGSAMLQMHPDQHITWGVMILVFSVLSWFGAAAGLIVGFVLGLIGGILAIAWKP